MMRCLQLASSAEGLTAPNPMVGALLVYEGKIIAEGKHAFCGAPHAEPDAINKVKDPAILKKCTLYVNLEPCSHYGKTPPCAEKIISVGIPHVVIGALDTSAKVNGKGIKMLNDAGVKTQTGVLEKEARELNKFFFTFHEKKRPYILLKWAQTKDGFIDTYRKNPDIPPLAISNRLTQILSHHWRTQYQAIMVGTNTVIMDNPSLTARKWTGKNPLRITIDKNNRLNPSYHIFNADAATLLFTNSPEKYGGNTQVINTHDFSLEYILNYLYSINVQSLIVEGGSELINSFIQNNLWNEAITFTSDKYITEGIKAPFINNKPVATEKLGNNEVERFINGIG